MPKKRVVPQLYKDITINVSPEESDSISQFSYDCDAKRLTIGFRRNGGIYLYDEVHPGVVLKMAQEYQLVQKDVLDGVEKKSASLGNFYQQYINGRYNCILQLASHEVKSSLATLIERTQQLNEQNPINPQFFKIRPKNTTNKAIERRFMSMSA